MESQGLIKLQGKARVRLCYFRTGVNAPTKKKCRNIRYITSERSPERANVLKVIKNKEQMNCSIMTISFSHCSGVSLSQWTLPHISESLDS